MSVKRSQFIIFLYVKKVVYSEILVYKMFLLNFKFEVGGKMYVMAFDTTAAACSILLKKDDVNLACFSKFMDFGQAEVLIPELQKILKANNLSFGDIGLLLVCVGPGSFTGVRSSVSAARTFQLASPDLKLGGISAFEAYTLGLSEDERAEINAVLIETKRDDFYVQLFDNALHKITSPQAMNYDDIVSLLRGHKVSLIGDGVERFLNRPSNLSLHCIKILDTLDIEWVAQKGLQYFYDKTLNYPKPMYLRAPDVSLPKNC